MAFDGDNRFLCVADASSGICWFFAPPNRLESFELAVPPDTILFGYARGCSVDCFFETLDSAFAESGTSGVDETDFSPSALGIATDAEGCLLQEHPCEVMMTADHNQQHTSLDDASLGSVRISTELRSRDNCKLNRMADVPMISTPNYRYLVWLKKAKPGFPIWVEPTCAWNRSGTFRCPY